MNIKVTSFHKNFELNINVSTADTKTHSFFSDRPALLQLMADVAKTELDNYLKEAGLYEKSN